MLIGAALLVLLGSGTVMFDRNGDGVDDGGLDLCSPPHPRVPEPLITYYLVANPTLPSLPGFLDTPRLPPKHLAMVIFSGTRSRCLSLNANHTQQ